MPEGLDRGGYGLQGWDAAIYCPGDVPMIRTGSTAAILAAVLFGLGTPLAALLGQTLSPWMLAGLLYLGSGIGLGLMRLVHGLVTTARSRTERGIRGAEWFWLMAAVFAGGVAGPVLLMVGLRATPASAASLFLNLEGLFTALLAWFVFHESFDRRLIAGMIAIMAGAVLLTWSGSAEIGGGWGPAAVAAACLMWAVDNNLTRKVSLASPMDIATIKGLVAGSVNVGIALALGDGIPTVPTVAAAMLVGLSGYGMSLALFVFALRHIGTARTGAYFSTAPFVGGVASLVIFAEPLTVGLITAALLMLIGVWLHLTEDHDHEHDHGEIEHDHPHVHDEHHQHSHEAMVSEPHTHLHRHGRLRHRHPHFPDAHHVHTH